MKEATGLRLQFPSDPQYLPLVRALVSEVAAICGFSEEDRGGILLAVTEAVTNVIRHVYDGATDQALELEVDHDEGGLELRLVDYGTWVDPKRIASRPLEDVRPGGLGVHLIKSTMDAVDYARNDHGGTTLVLHKRVPACDT